MIDDDCTNDGGGGAHYEDHDDDGDDDKDEKDDDNDDAGGGGGPHASKCHTSTSLLEASTNDFRPHRHHLDQHTHRHRGPSLLEHAKPCHCLKSCLGMKGAKSQNQCFKITRLEVEDVLSIR